MSVGYYTFAEIAQPHTNYLNLKKKRMHFLRNYSYLATERRK